MHRSDYSLYFSKRKKVCPESSAENSIFQSSHRKHSQLVPTKCVLPHRQNEIRSSYKDDNYQLYFILLCHIMLTHVINYVNGRFGWSRKISHRIGRQQEHEAKDHLPVFFSKSISHIKLIRIRSFTICAFMLRKKQTILDIYKVN